MFYLPVFNMKNVPVKCLDPFRLNNTNQFVGVFSWNSIPKINVDGEDEKV